MKTQQSIAERYRSEAVCLRREAMRVNSEAVRLQMLDVAQGYEDLAAIVGKLPPRPEMS
jgi:hypothetical protein